MATLRSADPTQFRRQPLRSKRPPEIDGQFGGRGTTSMLVTG